MTIRTLRFGVAALATGAIVAGSSSAWAFGATASTRPSARAGALGIRGDLDAVTATSARDAWAVGFTRGTVQKTLIAHWNGSAWKRAPSPSPSGPGGSALFGVAATSAHNAWAIGCVSCGTRPRTLILHWNGAAWKRVPSPNPTGFTLLSSVAAASATDAWAVGTTVGSRNSARELILHWNGRAWRRVRVPHPGSANYLTGIAAVSARDAWAVGTHRPLRAGDTTLVLHWNGAVWKRVPSPTPTGGRSVLSAVAASSAASVWAVGSSYNAGLTKTKTLIAHWNGRTWTQAPSPTPSAGGTLSSVTATSASNAWAVGYAGELGGSTKVLILRWRGAAWSRAPIPAPAGGSMLGVTATSASDAWAVGGFGGAQILRWNGAAWNWQR